MTEQEDLRCRAAKDWLRHEATKAVREDLERTLKEQWMLAPTPAEREAIYAKLVAMNDVFAIVEAWAAEQQIADQTARRLGA